MEYGDHYSKKLLLGFQSDFLSENCERKLAVGAVRYGLHLPNPRPIDYLFLT